MGSIGMADINIDPSVFTLASQPEGEEYGEQFEIVSKVAYLIGVPKRIFENDHEPPQIDIYNSLDLFNLNQNKKTGSTTARISYRNEVLSIFIMPEGLRWTSTKAATDFYYRSGCNGEKYAMSV